MSSCNVESTDTPYGEDVFNSSDIRYKEAKEEIKDILLSVLENAFDGESIDVVEYEKIISEKTGWSKDEIMRIEDKGLTRSTSGDDGLISNEQMDVLVDLSTYLSEKESITDDDVRFAEHSCSRLPSNEQREIILGLLTAKVTLDALTELEAASSTRATNDSRLGAAVCSLAVNGIGTLWSYMGTNVLIAAGVASGGAAVIGGSVALLGSYFLGKVACPELK